MGFVEFVAISATNSGRSPVTVTGYGFTREDGRALVDPSPDPMFPRIPHRLESHDEQSFMMWASKVRDRLIDDGLSGAVKLYPYVKLGNGTTVKGDAYTLTVQAD